ncbi:MAG: gliding motility-associated C-terminal domain-containing protein, partial [Bacteroidia bacterium]|nr:gliding motility-associated C-terminal domain-containing protein [Bacteroidia bacterium]
FELVLNVNPTYVILSVVEICNGATYTWHGNNYTTTGIYYDSLLTTAGCDSVFELNLTVNPVYSINESASICDGETYNWHGSNYTTAGTYYDSLQSISGCDSIFELTLNINPVYTIPESATICDGDTYSWLGNNYTIAGVYYDSLLTSAGCDSIFELVLNVNPTYVILSVVEICNGATYTWHGNNYTTTGTYYDSLLTTVGCDSVFELNLTVNSVYSINDTISICSGDSILLGGAYRHFAGVYYDTLISIAGCDSIIITTLTVNSLPVNADAGADQKLSYIFETHLDAIPPTVGVGQWSVVSGTGIISNSYDPNSLVENLSLGPNIFRWTVTNGVCPPVFDETVLFVNNLIIPTGFSPNGDLQNDYFIIDGLTDYSVLAFKVYNKWGIQVFRTENYANNWDGKDNNGKDLPEDYYYYIIKSGNEILYNGYVLIKR